MVNTCLSSVNRVKKYYKRMDAFIPEHKGGTVCDERLQASEPAREVAFEEDTRTDESVSFVAAHVALCPK